MAAQAHALPKQDREKTIQSRTMRAILERLVANPAGLKALLEKDDDDVKRVAKRARSASAASPEVVVIE